MNQEKLVEELVREVLKKMQLNELPAVPKMVVGDSEEDLNPETDYPLATKRPELVKTPTGKKLTDITLENILNGKITAADVRITPETLKMQAKIAEKIGRYQFANNLRRAAELAKIPDEKILEMYNALRPYRSTKEDLLEIADGLEKDYNAVVNANLIREAADVYKRRGILRTEE